MTVKAKRDHRALLRDRSGPRLLERLLAGRTSGHHRSHPLSGRLRCDYRGRTGDRTTCGFTPMRLALNLFVHRGRRQLHSGGEYQSIHRAALKACDALDGVADGLIADPTSAVSIRRSSSVTSSDDPSCLTAVKSRRRAACTRRSFCRPRGRTVCRRSCSRGPSLVGAAGRCGAARQRRRTLQVRGVQERELGLARVPPVHRSAAALASRRRRHRSNGSEPAAILRCRREAADVSRMGRSAGAAARHDRLFQRGPEDDERSAARDLDRVVHGAGREPLLRR